jgi:P27 family predicted phage terminase small subunit
MNKLEIEIMENMKRLEIYKPEFDITISIYCGMVEQYKQLEKDFKKQKFSIVEKTGYSDNKKKSPMMLSMETLRKDILNYANMLGLTPQGLKKLKADVKPEPKKSKLEMALDNFGT